MQTGSGNNFEWKETVTRFELLAQHFRPCLTFEKPMSTSPDVWIAWLYFLSKVISTSGLCLSILRCRGQPTSGHIVSCKFEAGMVENMGESL